MSATYSKFLVLLLLSAGEALSILAEMLGAKSHEIGSDPFWSIFLKMFLLITLAGGFLIAGYMLGYTAFKNIWIVSAVSITSILIIEPILAWSIFQQAPTGGAIAGLILGAIGLFLALFF